jgi:hypothetical protein
MAYQNRSTAPRGARPGHRSFGGQNSGGQRSGGRSGGGMRRGAYIHPSKFINKAVTKADEVIYESKHEFMDFAFSPDLQHNIVEKGLLALPTLVLVKQLPSFFLLLRRSVVDKTSTPF